MCVQIIVVENSAICENVEKDGKARQVTGGSVIRRMRVTWWINKAADTGSDYAILNAFPGQQWLCQPASMLLYSTLPVLLSLNTSLPVYQFVHTLSNNSYVMRRLQIACRLYNNVVFRQVTCERLSFIWGLLSPLYVITVLSVCVCLSALPGCLSGSVYTSAFETVDLISTKNV